MILNYLKIAYRFFKKNLTNSLLNVLGLAIGLASTIICLLHINYEFSFDKFHSKHENIYRLVDGNPNDDYYWAGMSAPVPATLKDNFPEIVDYVRVARFSYNPNTIVAFNNRSFYEDNVLLVDSSFFEIFDFKLLHGRNNEVLSSPNSVVITESNAKKYFGKESPLGKVINVDEKFNYTITGVVEDAPFNSHLEFDFLISFENLDNVYGTGHLTSWGQLNWWVYVLLEGNINIQKFEKNVSDYLNNETKAWFETGLYLQPLCDIHFQENRGNQSASYNIIYIYIFSAIALAVLIIACINFINFINAISGKRIKEVGLRKTFGANRKKIVYQFITESVLISLISLVLALLIIYYLIPLINSILNNNISFYFITIKQVFVAILLTILVGIISGSYIAFYMSSFSIIRIFKGIKKSSSKKLNFSNILIIAQFAISSILIISSVVIIRQLRFIEQKDIGLNKDALINIPVYGKEAKSKIDIFKKEIKQISTVKSVSASSFIAGRPNFRSTFDWEGNQDDRISFYIIPCDGDFIETMEFELIEGNLEELKRLPVEEIRWVVNEVVLRETGWNKAYKKILSGKEVGGVIKNFNFQSLHKDVAPLVFRVRNKPIHDQVFIRLSSKDNETTINEIKRRFNEIFPGSPFEYKSVNEQFNQLYKSESNASKIISFLSIISIVISLFGIFALISLMVKERTKEIAIRKVLGVSFFSLFNNLTKGFNKLLLIACVISWPFAFYLLKSWLNNFSYKASLNIFPFIISGVTILVIVQIIVSIKIGAAYRNDLSGSLRYE